MDDGRLVCGFPVDGYWNDVGTPASYMRANFDVLAASGNPHGSFTPRSAKIAAGAKLGPCAVLGEECVVEKGASVENSILWERSTVRAGVRIRGCVVGAGVTLTSDVASRVITVHGEAPIE
jgi:NDP-sugar pyrophosphorylase family protein